MKLILIDGMTGTGKSTTAQRLCLHLRRQGRAARWIYEHDAAHPIWPSGEQARMVEAGVLEADRVTRVLLQRWQALATDCADSSQATILESSLFQSTIGFLLAMRADEALIATHVMAVAEVIGGLQPALVYLRQGDVAAGLRATFEDRRADQYEANLVTLLAATPFGRAHDIADFAGLLHFYDKWRELTDALFARLAVAKIAISVGDGDWPSRERQLTEFLGLPNIGSVPLRIERASRYCGRYADAASSDEIVVAGNELGLYLDDGRRTRLIPACEDRFYLAAIAAEMAFSEEREGRFRRLELSSNLPGLSPLWLRTEGGG
jgi:hypothetical protein